MYRDTYLMNPEDVKFDQKIAGFNAPKTREGYEALKRTILKDGQERPILMRDAKCGDGVNRTKIAKELGIQVLAMDVDPAMSDKDFIELCNRDTFTGRNYTPTQLAILSYDMTLKFDMSDVEAKIIAGLPKDNKAVGYARTIACSPYGKKHKILEQLLQGKAVKIGASSPTKSIDVARRAIKILEEEEQLEVLPVETPIVDYNEHINTETAKEVFWKKYGSRDDVPYQIKMDLIAFLNMQYKLK